MQQDTFHRKPAIHSLLEFRWRLVLIRIIVYIAIFFSNKIVIIKLYARSSLFHRICDFPIID